MIPTEDLITRITRIVHQELSPLLTDALGPEHGWDAAEGVASAIIRGVHVEWHEPATRPGIGG